MRKQDSAHNVIPKMKSFRTDNLFDLNPNSEMKMQNDLDAILDESESCNEFTIEEEQGRQAQGKHPNLPLTIQTQNQDNIPADHSYKEFLINDQPLGRNSAAFNIQSQSLSEDNDESTFRSKHLSAQVNSHSVQKYGIQIEMPVLKQTVNDCKIKYVE